MLDTPNRLLDKYTGTTVEQRFFASEQTVGPHPGYFIDDVVFGSLFLTRLEVKYGKKLIDRLVKLVTPVSKKTGLSREPITKLYHGGPLIGGKMQPMKFSTTPDPAYAAKWAEINGGLVTKFEVPTRRFFEIKRELGVQRITDNIKGTSIYGIEWRFNNKSALEMNNYMR